MDLDDQITTRVDSDTVSDIEELSERLDRRKSEIIRDALRIGLDKMAAEEDAISRAQ